MNEERLLKTIKSQHLSEKATIAAEKRREYVFEVCNTATKPEIKQAVEKLFTVNVLKVTVLNVSTKPKRFGNINGRSKAWKKAYVTLQPGQKIDFVGQQ